MRQFEKEYREAMPQTIGETDRQFDDHNYTEFLEMWIVKLLATPAVSKSEDVERGDAVCCTKCGKTLKPIYMCTNCVEIEMQKKLKQTDC